MRGIMNTFTHINTKLRTLHFAQHFQENGHSFGPTEQITVNLHYIKKGKFMNSLENFYIHYDSMWAGIVQSVQPLTTGWTVRGSNPRGGEIFCTHPDRPWGPPSLLYKGYRVFPVRVKRPERGIDHPPLSSAEVTERVEPYLNSTSGPL